VPLELCYLRENILKQTDVDRYEESTGGLEVFGEDEREVERESDNAHHHYRDESKRWTD
jgi:hypothetical protein